MDKFCTHLIFNLILGIVKKVIKLIGRQITKMNVLGQITNDMPKKLHAKVFNYKKYCSLNNV